MGSYQPLGSSVESLSGWMSGGVARCRALGCRVGLHDVGCLDVGQWVRVLGRWMSGGWGLQRGCCTEKLAAALVTRRFQALSQFSSESVLVYSASPDLARTMSQVWSLLISL